MRTKIKLSVLVLLLSTLNAQLSTAFAQGNLTPPGPPAPTMKSLAQIEPRTPISTAPFNITIPGSYYLATNISVASGNAVTISTSNVMLDLNGFIISSTESPASTSSGILLNGVMNITIVNGLIKSGVTNNGSGTYSGNGFGSGIYFSGSNPVNTRVSGISVSGCRYDGIYLSFEDTRVESCVVRTVGSYGITAGSVSDSMAEDCGADAVSAYSSVNNCFGTSSGGGSGINCSGTAENCRGESANGTGVSASVANNCYGIAGAGSGDGVSASEASNCHGESSGSGNGVNAYIANNCGGSASGTGNGLSATSAINCAGIASGSGDGILATYNATGCYGYSTGGTGLSAYNAAFCTGSASGRAIQATLANGCIASGGTNLITFKYNMP